MPEAEVARCIVCGKVELHTQYSGAVVDLGEGIVVVGIGEADPEDEPLFWPDGMALASCDIHTHEQRLAAFAKYESTQWIEGKPDASN